MKRILAFLAIFLSVTVLLVAQKKGPFGTIDYVEGSATITRAGKLQGEANIGDIIYPDDMIKTSNDGLLVIALDKTTGMRGTLSIKAKSVIYIRFKPDAAGAKSSIELISGQIGSKLAKISGSPSLQVVTESAVMGVRGTEFGVATGATGSILVYCTEGAVACTDGGPEVSVPAGKAVEKKASDRLKLIPVAISDPKTFEKKWIADEIEAFKANAPRALADYAKRYDDLWARFVAAFDPLQKSEVLSKWIREDAAGTAPRSNDPTTMREKKDMLKPIMDIRKILFIFERIYYRIDQLSTIISGSTMEKIEVKKGVTAGDFLKRIQSEATLLERRVALFRYAEMLYSLRNEGGGFPGSDGDDDFFGTSDF